MIDKDDPYAGLEFTTAGMTCYPVENPYRDSEPGWEPTKATSDNRRPSDDENTVVKSGQQAILRKIRKKARKLADKSCDCFQMNYNRAHIEFLCLHGISLDAEIEFSLKRLYKAAAHIVRTIEILESDD